MFKSVLIAAVVLVAAPVFAQGAPESFNGPFVGIQGGWQQDRQKLETGSALTSGTLKSDGVTYGGQVGYDFRLSPSTVLGAEVSLTGRTGDTTLNDGFDSYELRQGRTVAATARLGFLATQDGLLYARGGYANARYTLKDAPFEASEDRDGYTVGAGYEQMLGRNASARIEYNYSDFGKDKFSTVGLPNDTAELNYRRHAVTAGLNFRF